MTTLRVNGSERQSIRETISENTRLHIVMLTVLGLLILTGILISAYTKPPFSAIGIASFVIGTPILGSGLVLFIYNRSLKGGFEKPESKPRTFQENLASLGVDYKNFPHVLCDKDAFLINASDFQGKKAMKGKDKRNAEFVAVCGNKEVWVFVKPFAEKEVIMSYENGNVRNLFKPGSLQSTREKIAEALT